MHYQLHIEALTKKRSIQIAWNQNTLAYISVGLCVCYDNIKHVLIEYGYDHVHRFYTALASSDSRNDSGKLYN